MISLLALRVAIRFKLLDEALYSDITSAKLLLQLFQILKESPDEEMARLIL